MDPVKEAFNRIKIEMNEFRRELSILYTEIDTLKSELKEIHDKNNLNGSAGNQTQNTATSVMADIKTNNPTDNQTEKWRLEGLKGENNGFSIGNEGVPTDKQTNFQTVTFADNINKQHNYSPEQNKIDISRKDFEYARDIMNSLDEIKIQIRDKFKQLTPQEWMVFSLLYSLEEQGISNITYKILANSLKLSESSIRDYINRLLTKGIPIEKTKINNKTVLLNISNNLKNIATLSTLMQLREL